MWQGWADNGIPPTGTVDYYDILTDRMEVRRRRGASRGCSCIRRCSTAAGTRTRCLDMIYPMVQWVEDKIPPDQLTITYAPTAGTSFTRPVYPYPDIPKYNGTGPQSSYRELRPGSVEGRSLHELDRHLPVLPRIQLQRYCGLRWMPNSCRISWARRGPVHNSVANPCLVGFSVSQRRMIFSCVVVSVGGRPGTRRDESPSKPCSRNEASQRQTVRGVTSRNSAISSAEYPSRYRRMASFRRCSSSSGEPLVLMQRSVNEPGTD